MNLEDIKKNILVLDCETWAEDKNGREVSIRTNFDEYVMLAKCRWFGAYSYRDNKEYYLEVSKDHKKISDLLDTHTILVGFNLEEFDYPIIQNNGLIYNEKKYNQIDCMKILGASSFIDKKGFKYKNRGELMGYKFKSNSLECIARTMGLEFQKSTIDYKIFQKDDYTPSERQEIITYLRNDVMATKGMFDKLWQYWVPFTDMLDYVNIMNLSWIKSSIASLIYKSACFDMGTEPTYSDRPGGKEEMGGRVLLPKYEEVSNAWYIDFTSLYPHIMCLFNLFSETDENNVVAWHGNNVFKVKGYYDISAENSLSKIVQKKLKDRAEIKSSNPNDPMVYTLKIWLNGFYGAARSAIFEKIHTENIGWDTCWLGQQIHELTENMMKEFGFESVYGDTDSLMVKALDPQFNNKEYVEQCLKKIVRKIFLNAPFPINTFNIKIEDYLHYVLFPFSDHAIVDEVTGKNIKEKNRLVKERKGRKKNYLYLHEKNGKLDIKITGFPIIKDNATPLGIKIFKEVLKDKILEMKSAKFKKEFINGIIAEYLKNKEILMLLATEYKVNPEKSYKKESQIQAQISKGYFNGSEGVINLIKNKKVGKAGKGDKYCTIDEAIEAKLTIDDLELEKLYNELEPFVIYEAPVIVEKPKKAKKTKLEKVS